MSKTYRNRHSRSFSYSAHVPHVARAQRFDTDIVDLIRPAVAARIFEPFPSAPLSEVYDGRRFTPPTVDTAAVYSVHGTGVPAQVVESPKGRLTFASPGRVILCARRGQRREVLHALGVAGGRTSRVRRRTFKSGVHC